MSLSDNRAIVYHIPETPVKGEFRRIDFAQLIDDRAFGILLSMKKSSPTPPSSFLATAVLAFAALPVTGEGLAYADKDLAAAYPGLSFIAEAKYPGAEKPDPNGGPRHTTVWVTGGDAPQDLAELAAFAETAGTPLHVYTLTDSADGSRLAPAYDELMLTPARKGAVIHCYPWADETEVGYNSKSWEIDSLLYRHPELLPVFHPGSRTLFHPDWRTPQASANSVLVSDRPAQAAIAAFRMRGRLQGERHIAAPSSALLRAALATAAAAPDAPGESVFDHLVCSQDDALHFSVTTTNTAPLAITLAWIDPGSWSFTSANPTTTLALDLDLEVSVVQDGIPTRWYGGMGKTRDTTHALESVTLPAAAAATYLITLRGTTVPDLGEGGAVALAIRGSFADGADQAVAVRTVTVRTTGSPVGDVAPSPGTYDVPGAAEITVRPAAYAYDVNGFGMAYARHPLAPVFTNAVADAGCALDVTVSWQTEPSDFRFRKLLAEDGDFENSIVLSDDWLPCGTRLAVDFEHLPPRGGSYSNNGIVYRAGGIGYEFIGEASWPYAVLPGAFTLDTGYDFTFSYYPETSRLYSERIPDYWFSRYLMDAYDYGLEHVCADGADPDGDGFTNLEEYRCNTDPLDDDDFFRITGMSPTRLLYRGGKDRDVVREFTESLCAPIRWQAEPQDAPLHPGRFYRLTIQEEADARD